MISKQPTSPSLLSAQQIWDVAPHNGMTDLIYFKYRWFCVFREGKTHAGEGNGIIRLLTSQEAIMWHSAATFMVDGVDLRDPKLSITPTGQLMLLVDGTKLDSKDKYVSLQCLVAFSDDGMEWTSFTPILKPHDWLWRVTWFQGMAYGAAYSRSDPKDVKKEWNIHLYQSRDGISWGLVTQWDLNGYPNETTLRFLKNGQMLALVRRDKRHDNHAVLGLSDPPYVEWEWHSLDAYVGGPNFLILPDDSMWIAGRMLLPSPYGYAEKTFVGTFDFGHIKRKLVLPSGGDCSYPGMVYHDGLLWISYYSSHENNKAAIFLARIAI